MILLIAHYSSPLKQRMLDKELNFFIANASKRYPNINMVIAGDLNRNLKMAAEIAVSFNLGLCKYPQELPTFMNTRTSAVRSFSQTDYIMSNAEWSDTLVEADLESTTSDHRPLSTTIHIGTEQE